MTAINLRRAQGLFWAALALTGFTACGSEKATSPLGEREGAGIAHDDVAALERDLTIGSSGEDVRFLNEYLVRYGYLPNAELQTEYPAWRAPVKESPAAPDVYDDATAEGVRVFQANFGLPVTGIADEETRLRLNEPRCGTPDNIEKLDASNKFDATPGGWGSKTNLTIKVTNAPSGMTLTQARNAIMAAAQQWTYNTYFTVTQVTSGTADITLNFANNVFCAGGSINAYARATGPGPGACITFNTGGSPLANWSVASPTPTNSKDLQSIAMHELGHTLGLGHSGYSNAVMYPDTPFGTQRRLQAPDDTVAGYALGIAWTLFDSYGENDVDVDDGGLFYTRTVTADPVLPSGERSVWSYTNAGPWINMSGSGAAAIGGSRVSSNSGATWIVQNDGDIYSYNSGTSWTKRTGCAKDIAVGPDNSVWVLGCAMDGNGNYPAFRWNGSSFVQDATGGAGVRISVGKRLDSGATVPWVTAANGAIYRRSANDTSSTASWQLLPGAATDIAANASGYTWVVGTSPVAGGYSIHVLNEQPASSVGGGAAAKLEWDLVPGGAINIAASSSGGPSVVNNLGEFFEY